MSSSFSWKSLLQTCLVLVLVICILVPDDVMAIEKRKSRSNRRQYRTVRYRVGYIYGKRSKPMEGENASSKLFDAISRRLIPLPELIDMLRENPEILMQVVRHLDKDDDGYITVADLM